MKSVPKREQSEEDFFSDIKQSVESPILKNKKCTDNSTASPQSKENGYLTTLKNIPCLLVMLGNIPAIMGLYIPYMFLPGVRTLLTMIATLLILCLDNPAERPARIWLSSPHFSHWVLQHRRPHCGRSCHRPPQGWCSPGVNNCIVLWYWSHYYVSILDMCFTGAICPFLMTLCFDFWSFTAVCIFFGLSLSAWVAVTSPLLVIFLLGFFQNNIYLVQVDLLGLELLTSAFGILTCLRGVAALLGPPLAGFVIDITTITPVEGSAFPQTNYQIFSFLVSVTTKKTIPDTSLPATEDLSNYEVAFGISASLLSLAAVGHLMAFCARKATTRRAFRIWDIVWYKKYKLFWVSFKTIFWKIFLIFTTPNQRRGELYSLWLLPHYMRGIFLIWKY